VSRRNTRAGKARRRAERHVRRQGQDQALRESAHLARRTSHVLDVELSRLYFPDDELGGEFVSWFAEWALRDDPMGIEDNNEDLHQLIDDLTDSARREWADPYDLHLTIEWEITGDAPPGKTVEDMVAEAGVTLPTAITPLSGRPAQHDGSNE
jgi:hypothetical protein